MIREGEEDDSFAQLKAKITKKGNGFDGFGSPEPFNHDDDDEVDAGEPNSPPQSSGQDDPNMIHEGEEDDSFAQLKAKITKKGDGFDGFGSPDPFNHDDD